MNDDRKCDLIPYREYDIATDGVTAYIYRRSTQALVGCTVSDQTPDGRSAIDKAKDRIDSGKLNNAQP